MFFLSFATFKAVNAQPKNEIVDMIFKADLLNLCFGKVNNISFSFRVYYKSAQIKDRCCAIHDIVGVQL